MDRLPHIEVALKPLTPPLATTGPANTATSQPAPMAGAAASQPLASAQPSGLESSAPLQQVILARNLTATQMQDLKACVATIEPAENQNAAPAGAAAPAATRPATAPSMVVSCITAKPSVPATMPAAVLQAGDVLGMTDSASDQVSIQSVSPDGTVNLTGVGEVPVAGLTVEQASDDLTKALAHKDAGNAKLTLRLIRPATGPSAPALASRHGVAASTRPAGLVVAQQIAPGTRPAAATTQPFEHLQATTQPLAEDAGPVAVAPPASQPAELRMDVVIVVQPDSSVQTSPATATQPALIITPSTTAPATGPGF